MENPTVSIVILTTGNAEAVQMGLGQQTYRNFEVILARESGIVRAMNRALCKAKGEIFVRIDDDVQLPVAWLENLVAPFSDPVVAGVTGPTYVPTSLRKNRDSIRWAETPNWFLRWIYDGKPYVPAKIYKCGNVSYGSNFEEKIVLDDSPPDYLEGTNWAMRTYLIRKVGGFDPKFDGVAEWFDVDVQKKIQRFGFTLVYNPKAFMYHLLGKSQEFSDRFEGMGRIKNWLRFHIRHSKFHPKMIVFLTVWSLYFLWKKCATTKK